MLDDFLLQVNRPARYIGEEWNVSRKDFESAGIKFALCFPDLYEIGMSNLGIRIIYGILNNLTDVCCERFFSPAQDMEQQLRALNSPILSLESKKPPQEFDFLGFSLGFELCFTNVLNILELGRIPLRADLRGPDYPLVIGGGPCALNPEPLYDFFDLFLVGEAEEAILEIIAIYRRHKEQFKAGRMDKKELLFALAQVEGAYVPSLYEVIYDSGGRIKDFRPKVQGVPPRIKKRFVKDLNNAYFPVDWLVPYIQIVHDRITLEVMRGCPNQCRFCQARSQYFPFRLRNKEGILGKADELYKRTGYEEISLVGLSVSDYPKIEKLLESLIAGFKEKAVSVSLPSIKPKEMVGSLASVIASIKKTGLTFAPEAASVRLRRMMNKDFDTRDFFNSLEQAYLAGYRHVKLYFMIGLPQEEDNDLDSIIDFSTRVSELRRKVSGVPAQVNISVNALIPKPHTPLQWLKMEKLEAIKYKQRYLRTRTRNKRLNLNTHNPVMSFLEGVLSRGDRRLSAVILGAFRRGARFDGWDNYFMFDKWIEAFREAGIDPDFYLQERSSAEILPWDFIDTGIDRQSLTDEFNKIVAIRE